MQYQLFFAVLFVVLHVTECTLGPSDRKGNKPEKVAATPPPAASPPQRKQAPAAANFQKPSSPTDTNVLHRNLIQETIDARTIVENHLSYCSECVETRQFIHPTLVYVTPWNSHGYEIAKLFIIKFDYISPVWFSVRRTGIDQYTIDGKHDIDSKWVETLKEKRADVRIVPRVIFEKWSVEDIHALFQSETEKQALASTMADFLVEYNQFFDGFVLELLLQFRGSSKPTLNHIVVDIAERIHRIEGGTLNRKKELILAVPPYDEIFDTADFEALYEHLDGFSVMTYDFPNREPGPVAPIEWIQTVMNKFTMPESDGTVKLFLGLNFYGYRYDRVKSPSSSGKNQKEQQLEYQLKPILGRDYIDFLREYSRTAMIVYDRRSQEHVTAVQRAPSGGNQQQNAMPEILIFYPSLQSIHQRLELANRLNVGVAIWDGGQGLDYFFDLL